MRSLKMLKAAMLLFSFPLFTIFAGAEENDPQGVALLQKVTDAYKNASSFSCEGRYENDLQTAQPVKLMGTFKILFVRPDEIRIDWDETNMGGEVITNSVFTQDKEIFFYWGLMGKWSAQKDMETALGTAAGISHGVTYSIPSLLRGKPGYLTFTSLAKPTSTVVDGVDCLLLTGHTRFQGDMEIAIDPTTYAIRQIKATQIIRHKDLQKQIEKAREELTKTNPELAAKMKDIPATPDFTSVNTTTYKDPVFGRELTAAELVYPVPVGAQKVDKLF